ncbi:MAG TPA: hypothetical protein VIH18_00495, partial [Candidatus Binatia bacterium]
SMVLCLAGHHPVLSIGGNARRQGLKQPLRSCARALQVSPLGRCLVTQLWTLNKRNLMNAGDGFKDCRFLEILAKTKKSACCLIL